MLARISRMAVPHSRGLLLPSRIAVALLRRREAMQHARESLAELHTLGEPLVAPVQLSACERRPCRTVVRLHSLPHHARDPSTRRRGRSRSPPRRRTVRRRGGSGFDARRGGGGEAQLAEDRCHLACGGLVLIAPQRRQPSQRRVDGCLSFRHASAPTVSWEGKLGYR